MASRIARATATIQPNGAQPFVEVFDSPDNFAVFTLSLHDKESGATLSTLATNENSFDFNQPKVKYVLPLAPEALPGKVLVCAMTLVPVAPGAGRLKFTLNVKQGTSVVDDGGGVLDLPSTEPITAAIRLELQ
jgi:hypothetical protein